MKESSKFWDKLARKYAADPIKNQEAYQAKLDITQSYFLPDTQLFEFGCGTGSTAIHHAPHVASVLATDISKEMLAIARERKAEAGVENIRFEHWNIETDSVTEDTFDVIMAHSILHLVNDLAAALEKVNALTKPGGVFISSTVCLGDWNFIFRLLLPVMQIIGKAPHVSFLKRDELRTAIEKAGFEILKLPKPVGGDAEFIVARKR